MEQDRVVYVFRKNAEEEIRLSLRTYRERLYFGIRLWFQPSNGGEYRPTRKGITLGLEHLSEFKKGLDRVQRLASELTLQESSNPVK